MVHPACRIPRLRKRAGRCYELALRGVLRGAREGEEWTLVHGTCRGIAGSTVGHTWLERGGVVYDPVRDQQFTAEEYATTYGAASVVRYSSREAATAGGMAGNYGPWEPLARIDGLVW